MTDDWPTPALVLARAEHQLQEHRAVRRRHDGLWRDECWLDHWPAPCPKWEWADAILRGDRSAIEHWGRILNAVRR